MIEVLLVLFTGLLAFMSADYTLARAKVEDPKRAVIAAIFAVLLVVVAGVLALGRVINFS